MLATRRLASWVRQLITLTFRSLLYETPLFVRGRYFRICADATLRGPDNEVAATYIERTWRRGSQRFSGFECSEPVYLRVVSEGGERERLGPYEFLRAADGALFSNEKCIGMHCTAANAGFSRHWHEITILPAAFAA